MKARSARSVTRSVRAALTLIGGLAAAVIVAEQGRAEPLRTSLQRVELGVFGGFHLFDGDLELGVVDLPGSVVPNDGAIFGLRAAVHLLPELGLEAELGAVPTTDSLRGESTFITITRVHAVLTTPPLAERLRPFLVAGGGWMTSWTSPSPGVVVGRDAIARDTDYAWHWGAGLKIDLGDHLLVRIDFRHTFVPDTRDHGTGHDLELSLGLSYLFAGAPPTAPPPVAPTEPTLPEPDPPHDGQGLHDVEDVCAADPAACKVRFDGCEIAILERVEFAYDRSDVDSRSFGLLDTVAEVVRRHPWIKRVEIQGHTDGDGSADYNLRLSQERADAVRGYLVAQGVEEARLVSRGYGLTRPIASNATAHGRAVNRRVQFVIVDPPQERCTRTPTAP